MRPVLVTASPPAAAQMLVSLLDDYYARVAEDSDPATISIEPIDSRRRGTVIYRVIQASRTVAGAHPDALLYLITEDGNRWRLPPPAI